MEEDRWIINTMKENQDKIITEDKTHDINERIKNTNSNVADLINQ